MIKSQTHPNEKIEEKVEDTTNKTIKETIKETIKTPKKSSKKKKEVKKKHTFLLKGIDNVEVDKKYGINVAPTIEYKEHVPENTTAIDELYSCNKQSFFIPFIDESRRHCITMIDSITKKSIQSDYCFWCRHSFGTIPIGCPIRYVNNKIIKLYTSEITKEKYVISHEITRNEYQKSEVEKGDKHTKLVHNDYYETDGSFCSFNCCLAFIKDNIHNSLYINSKNLLMKMYSDIFNSEKLLKITPAPSWRLLKEYGGFMNIQEFRESFTNYIYISNDYHVSRLPKVMPIGHIFEEHIIF